VSGCLRDHKKVDSEKLNRVHVRMQVARTDRVDIVKPTFVVTITKQKVIVLGLDDILSKPENVLLIDEA